MAGPKTRIQWARATAARWAEVDPILLIGEWGYETDTGKVKVGNDVSTWSALPYKFDGSGTSSFKGYFATTVLLDPTVRAGIAGDYAINGETNTFWFYDIDTTDWIDSGNSAPSIILDPVPTAGSVNGAESGGIYAALQAKANTEHTHIISNIDGLQSELDAKVNSADLIDDIFNSIQQGVGINISIDEVTGKVKITNTGVGAGSANWGGIGGTLSTQTDLMLEFANYVKKSSWFPVTPVSSVLTLPAQNGYDDSFSYTESGNITLALSGTYADRASIWLRTTMASTSHTITLPAGFVDSEGSALPSFVITGTAGKKYDSWFVKEGSNWISYPYVEATGGGGVELPIGITDVTGLTAALAAKASQTYVDSAVEGLKWKESARAASTGNLTLSGAQTVDGVSLIAGDRILVKDQTTGSQNGIYVVAAGAWSRSNDANTAAELLGATVNVREGTTNADKDFVLTTDSITLGSTVLTFVEKGAAIPNASETVAGKVEEATDAEVTAGTATGATGAKLFVSPAKLLTWWGALTLGTLGTLTNVAISAGDSIKAALQKLQGQINAKWINITSGNDQQIIYNDNGIASGDANAKWNKTSKRLTLKAGGNADTDKPLVINNALDQLIMEALGDRSVRFGGDSHQIVVPETVTDSRYQVPTNKLSAWKMSTITDTYVEVDSISKRWNVKQELNIDQGYNGPKRIKQGGGQSTGTTAIILETIPIETGTMMVIEATVVGRNSDLTNRFHHIIRRRFVNIGGTITADGSLIQIEYSTTGFVAGDGITTGVRADFNISGTDVQLRFIGQASVTVDVTSTTERTSR